MYRVGYRSCPICGGDLTIEVPGVAIHFKIDSEGYLVEDNNSEAFGLGFNVDIYCENDKTHYIECPELSLDFKTFDEWCEKVDDRVREYIGQKYF